MDVRRTSRRMRFGIVFLLIALVAVGVAAAPVWAQPTPTSLSASALTPVIVYGHASVITGTLATAEDPPLPLGGLWVEVWFTPKASGDPMTLLATVTTDPAQYATGQYTVAIAPQVRTLYQFRFAGAGGYASSQSDIMDIQIKPALGRPNCPTSVKHGTKFTVKGPLKPQFTAGAKTVTVKAYKMNKKNKWVLYRTYKATNHDYKGHTQYRRSLTLGSKGQYHFKALTKGTSVWAAAVSAYSRTLTVK